MPLYCYIVETGCYEDVCPHILGHSNKYSQKEFDNICKEIINEHGDVEEIEYTIQATLEHVEKRVYKLDSDLLIDYLIKDYGFIELDVPFNDGYMEKKISCEPVPTERLKKVVVETPKCPHSPKIDEMMFCKEPNTDFKMDVGRINARCSPELIIKGDYCDTKCIHYICDYETRYDENGNIYEDDISRCELGHYAIEDASFCKHYEN